MRVLIPLLLALQGCILATEDCGFGFEEIDGRCVPVDTPEPFRDEREPRAVRPDDDGGVGVVDAGEARPDPWSVFKVVLIVDRSEAVSLPPVPGADIDAVTVEGSQFGFGVGVLDAQINDPFGASLAKDPRSAIGTPDAFALFEDFDFFVSLGTEGGFVKLGLELERPLEEGDEIVVHELDEDDFETGIEERYEVYLCVDERSELEGCRSLGIGSGVSVFPL